MSKALDLHKSIWWCEKCNKGCYGVRWTRPFFIALWCGHVVSHNFRVSLNYKL